MMYKKIALGILGAMLSNGAYSDTVKIGAVVLDDETALPMPNVEVCFSFKEDVGWRAWTESSKHHKQYILTDTKGYCQTSGQSNCGQAGCYVKNPPHGYYHPALGWKNKFTSKNLFGVWQPDNLVATIRLQRVEHPIPLFVKRVELRDYERGIGGFDGTNSVLRFDLLKGDWLHPYGNGEVADICIGARVNKTGSERRFLPQEGTWGVLQFYDIIAKFELCDGDCLSREAVKESAGIKIRSVAKDGVNRSITRTKGKRKQIDRNKDWHCEYFSDSEQGCCYTFRIRSRRNEKGELVEAYYGKVYGDFSFEGDDKKGLIGVKFFYYLNPKSLDHNLEWDMKNNLCPNPGSLGQLQP